MDTQVYNIFNKKKQTAIKSPQKTCAANSSIPHERQIKKSPPSLLLFPSVRLMYQSALPSSSELQLKGVSGFSKLLKGMIDFQAAVGDCCPEPEPLSIRSALTFPESPLNRQTSLGCLTDPARPLNNSHTPPKGHIV